MSDESWSLDHYPYILMQIENRPGPVQADGRQWADRRLTGMGTALCACGYTTGLIPQGQLPDFLRFAREHPPLGWVDPFAAEAGERQ